jgi:hypothetical protein
VVTRFALSLRSSSRAKKWRRAIFYPLLLIETELLMIRRLFFAVVFSGVAMLSHAEDAENPYKTAKVGDWVEYTSHTAGAGFSMESKSKQTVMAKTDKEVTIKIESEMQGQKNSQEQKIDLTKKFDPNDMSTGMPGGMKPKVEKVKEGDEAVTIGGKKYDAHWVENKVTMEMQGAKIESDTKSWISKDAPLGGLVKMEMNMSAGMKMTMELSGSGNGAK